MGWGGEERKEKKKFLSRTSQGCQAGFATYILTISRYATDMGFVIALEYLRKGEHSKTTFSKATWILGCAQTSVYLLHAVEQFFF